MRVGEGEKLENMRKIKKDQRMKRQQEGEGRMRKREQMIKREGPDSDKEDRKKRTRVWTGVTLWTLFQLTCSVSGTKHPP